jgi:hypothetical protein
LVVNCPVIVINIFYLLYHLSYEVVEYRFLALGSIDPEAKLIKVPVQVLYAFP